MGERLDMDEEWPDPDLRDAALDRVLARIKVHVPPTPLTLAELRVLRCLSHGLDRNQTAEAIGVKMETVQSQLKSAQRKLAAKTTTQTVCEALRQQLIP